MSTPKLENSGKGPSSRLPVMTSTIRCLRVLELLATDPAEFSRADVAIALSIPPASAHRLLMTLCKSGLAEQDSSSRRYRLTGKALWVGTGYLRHSAVYRASFVFMQDLARRVEGMLHLGVLDQEAVLFLHSVGQPSSVYLFADTGERRPAHATAMGKTILAYLPVAEVDRLISRGPERCTQRTITSLAAMKQELGLVRERGYAVNNEELLEGLTAVAAPIRNRKGEVVASISISGTSAVLNREKQTHYGEILKEVARKISVQMGYRPQAAVSPSRRDASDHQHSYKSARPPRARS